MARGHMLLSIMSCATFSMCAMCWMGLGHSPECQNLKNQNPEWQNSISFGYLFISVL